MKKNNRYRMMFAMVAVIAVTGILMSSSMAIAIAPKFQVIRSAETVWQDSTHVCNENYGIGTCASLQACTNKAMENGYQQNQIYCTEKAYEDCGSPNEMGYICYCNAFPQNC